MNRSGRIGEGCDGVLYDRGAEDRVGKRKKPEEKQL